MKRIVFIACVSVLAACDTPSRPSPWGHVPVSEVPRVVPTPPQSDLSITGISPTTAIAGSAEFTLTITGEHLNYGSSYMTWAIWSRAGVNTMLGTPSHSDTELKAVVPADLLRTPGIAHILVGRGDPMSVSDGFEGYARSNALDFEVTVRPAVAARQ